MKFQPIHNLLDIQLKLNAIQQHGMEIHGYEQLPYNSVINVEMKKAP
jgi:hypothetical protein